MKSTANLCTSLTLSACFAFSAFAADVTIPNQFSAGTPAVAAEVNDNFTAVKTAVDDNNSRVGLLEKELEAQQAAMQSMQAALNRLQATNDQLSNFVANVLPYLRGAQDAQGNPAVFFSGANVHINNGEGSTPTINGTGNLIVGYDETSSQSYGDSKSFCTVFAPFVDDALNPEAYLSQEACEAADGAWTSQVGQHKIGSHNLVIGQGHNYTQYASLITGKRNTASAPMSFALGDFNIARGWASSITGGRYHIATGVSSSITGGSSNTASGHRSSITGGSSNTASGHRSSITGGNFQTASGELSSINGGSSNFANGEFSTVSAGSYNVANGMASAISGGSGNRANSLNSTVSGGASNSATGRISVVSGGENRTASGDYDWAAGSLFEED